MSQDPPAELRDAFLVWIEQDYPPVATVEVNHEPQRWPADKLLRHMLRCPDYMPRSIYEGEVERLGLERSHKPTYSSFARVLLDARREQATNMG